MDSNFRYLDVDQDLDLSLSYAYPSQQSAHSTSPGCSRFLSIIERHFNHPLDRSVPTSRQSLA